MIVEFKCAANKLGHIKTINLMSYSNKSFRQWKVQLNHLQLVGFPGFLVEVLLGDEIEDMGARS